MSSSGNQNPWQALFGRLIYLYGEGLYTIHHHKRPLEIETHLQLLIDMEPEAFWFVVLDNASAHITQKLQLFAECYRN